MKDSVNKGLATNPILHKYISAKGGRVKKPKGLAKLSIERRREIASMGGKKRAAKYKDSNSRTDSGAEE